MTGAHRKVEIPFPDWVPPEVLGAAAELTVPEAREQLPEAVLER